MVVNALIASRSPLFVQGIRHLLISNGVGVTGSAHSAQALYHALRTENRPFLIVVDACLPGLVSFNRLRGLGLEKGSQVFLLTEREDDVCMRRALFHGVQGIAAKTSAVVELTQALTHVAAGGCWYYGVTSRSDLPDKSKHYPEYHLYRLSRQESNVLKLVLNGLRNKEIARVMSLTEHTVKTHISSILRKLDIDNRTQLVVALKQVKIY